MKNLFLFVFSTITLSGFSQAAGINFTLVDGMPKTTYGGEKITLPLNITFDAGLLDKTVRIKKMDGSPITPKIKLGADILPANGKFTLTVDKDRKTVPGGHLIEKDSVKLVVDTTEQLIVFNSPTIVTPPDNPAPKPVEIYQPGYMYYDALKFVDGQTVSSDKLKILAYYGITNQNTLRANPYLSEIYKEVFAEAQGANSPISLAGLGNMDVTYFAAGLARFLAERTKEELNEAFFKEMKKQLNAYPELLTIFPKTTSFLDVIETYTYASVLQALKSAFETDIQNLPTNLYDLKDLSGKDCDSTLLNKTKYSACTARLDTLNAFFHSRPGRWIGLGMFMVKETGTSFNPADLLKSVSQSDELKEIKTASKKNLHADYNIASSIQLGNRISQSLLNKDPNQQHLWVTTMQMSTLFNTKDALKAYLGLLLAQERNTADKIIFYNDGPPKDSISLDSLLVRAHRKSETDKIGGLIKNAYTAYNATNNAIKQIIAATENSHEIEPQQLYNYYATLNASLKAITQNPLLNTYIKGLDGQYLKIEQYITPSVDLLYHVSTKKYTAAIYDLVALLNNIKTPALNGQVTKSLLKYGTLVASVANAESSDDVKKAIEASVLPVGSSSIKRNSAWSISVNAYVGGYYGNAYSTLRDPATNKRMKYQSFGLYAPIGVSFNRGSRCGLGGSLIVQVIDVGALVNFYMLNGDSTAFPSDFRIRLSNIFAPGVQLGLNIPRTPLTFTGGVQFVPALYKTDQIVQSGEIVAANAWRLQASLVVDIPMYNVKVWDFKRARKKR